MERRVEILKISEGKEIYNERLLNDFPACEVKPWERIEQLIKKGLYKMFGMWEGDRLLAYAFVSTDAEKTHFLMDYFAVDKENRGKGYGQYFLQKFWELYPEAEGVVFEVEDVAEAKNESEREIRKRRIRFYERAGLQIYPVHAKVYDASYQLMFFAKNEKMPEKEELIENYKALYKTLLGEEKMVQYMKIMTK